MHEKVMEKIVRERKRQDDKWGVQDRRVGHNRCPQNHGIELHMRGLVQDAASKGNLTWLLILGEELAEVGNAYSEDDAEKELVQVAAVAIAALENIQRRKEERINGQLVS